MADRAPTVAVVGGGWAGCAAALTLAERGIPVALFEAAPTLGGRARRVERDGLAIDNGAHLLLGAYRETLRQLASVHAPESLRASLDRRPLALVPPSPAAEGVTLAARALPAPLGLLAGLAMARGLSVRDRFGAARWFARLRRQRFCVPPGQTVAQLLDRCPAEVAQRLWAPLCVAALNTHPDRACARTFANVLAAAFAQRAGDADMLVTQCDLSSLFPDRAAARIAALGGDVHAGVRAMLTDVRDNEVTLRMDGHERAFAGAIVAVGPHQLSHAFDPALGERLPTLQTALQVASGFAYEPIVTVWLGYSSGARLPAPVVRLDDAPGQWAFERSDVVARAPEAAGSLGIERLLAVVISAGGPHDSLDRDELADAVDAQLRRLVPGWEPARWWHVIRERRATYACTPARPRLAATDVHPRVLLAGDYVDAEFPATIEAAVRSGVAAAKQLSEAVVARTTSA